MIQYLNSIPNEYREHLNKPLLDKTFDKPLEEFIFQAFKGFEIIPNIKILGYEWVPDEDKYDMNDHVVRRNTNKNKLIKNIAESRCGVMYIDAEVSGYNKNGEWEIHYLKKPIILPIEDEDGYLMIKGKRCYIIYQLVDKILYPSFGAVTVKSLMPICVKTNKCDFTDTEGNVYTIPVYNIQIFRTAINVLLMYSHLTMDKMLGFMEVSRFIHIERKSSEYPKVDNIIRFECDKKSDISVVVRKDIFDQEIYVRSIVGCLINLFNETHIEYDKLNSWEEWMIIVGGKNTIRRGIYQHIFFNRLLDLITENELKISDYDKQDIYHLLRWILENYHDMWAGLSWPSPLIAGTSC